ncbi:hypothetical protein LUZ60_001570 [Juncus effusus]|nr:hypothetical protein LUZ60_001570 [Juncus effusus]
MPWLWLSHLNYCSIASKFSTVTKRISAPLRFPNAVSSQLRRFASILDVAARDGELRVFLVAGEVSGDAVASRLMQGMNELSPVPVSFSGVGGELMRKRGLESLFPMEEISVMGIWELLPHILQIRSKIRETVQAALSFQPHVVVTVDSKGFSFRFLNQLKSKYIQSEFKPTHVHYVAPSFWAWKGGEKRLKNLSLFIDHILCILPFEGQICNLHGINATYVGHPLLDDASSLNPLFTIQNSRKENISDSDKRDHNEKTETFLKQNRISPGSTVLTVLPGSRLQEVTTMLPIYSETIKLLKTYFPDLSLIIPIAPNPQVENYIKKSFHLFPPSTVLIPGASIETKYVAYNVSRAALCTSGSAVMELMLAGLPCVVAYKAHLITELFIHFRKKINYISLPNILLNSNNIPEILFRNCTPQNLAKTLREVILDESVRELQISSAKKVIEMLKQPMEDHAKDHTDFGHIKSPDHIASMTILHLQRKP